MIPKFRVWCKNRKEWEKDICFISQDGMMYQRYSSSPVPMPILTKNHDVLQSTGLNAKNGTEIYEGDICECVDGLKNYWYVIEWIYAGWQVVTYKKPHTNIRGISDGINQAYLEPDYSSQLKIIGNIYENPELLEVENSDTAI